MSFPSSLPLHQVRLRRGWLASRAATVRDTVIPQQWEALNDRIPGAERSGCVHNLEVAAGEKPGEFHGLFWQDSDIAKWIEAASYRLATHPDAELDAQIDRLIATIARAQRSDGYLNTYFTLVEPGNRWANLRDCHELYVAGHFIEAGVAHFEATGKRGLLDVVCRLADLVGRTFGSGPGRIPGYCGHEEIELALVKLARATGDVRHLDLAAYFIDQRGQEPNYFAAEAERRGDKALPWHMYHDGLATLQAAVPVRTLQEPVGHAVRMTYLLAAMIDLAREREDSGLAERARQLWKGMTERHLYVTGGVGAEPYGEKFSAPYDLPPDRAYAETCAAIGVVLCARRMLELELDGRHADVMERALYNNVLAGLSLDGRRYFYVNPLEIVPALAKRRYECHLVKTQRVPWFGCACCPPNIARLLASIGEYVCTRTEDGLAVHLYGGWEAGFAIGGIQARVTVSTEYPWEGTVRIAVAAAQPLEATLRLRIPGWTRGATMAVNGGPAEPVSAEKGYAAIRRRWGGDDRVVLEFPMPVERVRADARVASAAGRVALQRGPVVYAFEEVDNGEGLAALRLSESEPLRAVAEPALLGGCMAIEAAGFRLQPGGTLYATRAPGRVPVTLRAVPYALWGNRGEGEMTVWIHEN
jgi:uncharacterized protein